MTEQNAPWGILGPAPQDDGIVWNFGESPYPGLGEAIAEAVGLELVVLRWDDTQETVWEVQRRGQMIRRRGVANEWLRAGGPPLREQVVAEAAEFMWSAYQPFAESMEDYLWTA